MKYPAIFLDRDGILNEVIFRGDWLSVPYTPEEVVILPSVADALSKLKNGGFKLIVVTNQPNISCGELAVPDLERIHEHMLRQLPHLDAFYYCPHSREDNCRCKKPLPGMIEQAAREHGIDIGQSYVIGDRKGDIDMGKTAGVRASILIPSPATRWHLTEEITPDIEAQNVLVAAEYILSR